VLCCVLLTVSVLIAYSPVIRNGFLNYDDDRYITDNAHVKTGLTWATVKWAFTTYDEANWAPLSWLSHALDCKLFGLNPAGHHFVSVLFHGANVVLLFLLVQGLTRCRWRSLVVAALFGLHPINVESVAWAAERKNLLSMTFCLLALLAYLRYTHKPSVPRYAVVFVMFAFGLMSKSQIITLPFLLLLLDYWPLGRMSAPGRSVPTNASSAGSSPMGWLVAEKLPLLLLSAASAKLTMNAEKAGGAVQSFARYSFALRIETAFISYVRYLGKAVWPVDLVALYPHPTMLYPIWHVAAAVFVLALITIAVFRGRQRRYLLVGWLWFLGSMVPMIGLVQVGPQALADRFAYLPFIGLFLMVTWLAADGAGACTVPKRWIALPVIGYLLALSLLTYRQVGYWRDIPSFWERTLAFTQGNYIAENNLGDFLFKHGRVDEAAAHLQAALAIQPENLVANMNLAAYEDSRGNMGEAIARYEALTLRTADVDIRASAYTSMGFDYRQMGQAAEATRCFETAVQLAPYRSRAIVGLGLMAQDQGRLGDAIQRYAQAAATHPTDVTYLLLAKALDQAGRSAEAREASAHITDLAAAEGLAKQFFSAPPPLNHR
jgi:protein O-mannosyl-transferase